VAEGFTGRKGVYVPVKETVRGFAEISAGKHDAVPEEDFYMAGAIDEVASRVAERQAKEQAASG
jgi:F-type H+-transporting ATPase subunit beta